ncbi:glycerol kinase [Dictyobacter sp. S3.2.2.5]|uniref:ATP:glycerol 3-phosphotransferase n=1 Tax=Dictyobacter halimunensis TaxID=3026934 RepID=A0ABQ6FNX5_9CHLR|nr:glycerol kinase [Dictyobacter sp. S3.2.2.5]
MMRENGTILAIDQGTTNTKVLLIDGQGRVVAQSSRPVAQWYPQPSWVEQDADHLWQSVCQAIDACLASVDAPRPEAIAITNQRESVVMWDRKSGRPLAPVIGWQCRRTADFCTHLREQGLASFIAERTGLTLDPLFSASKMRWLLDHLENGQQRAASGEICLGTVDSWLLWNLTGGRVHACDFTNAARTQVFDIRTLEWSDDLLSVFGIPRAALPDAHPSKARFGSSVALGHLPAGVPIMSMIGDSHAALFGQAGFVPGSVKATYGTGSSLMTPTREMVVSKCGLSTTIAWALDREHVTYALEGNISVTGAAVQWLGEFLGTKEPTVEIARLADQVESAEGLYLVPAFVGLGAPHWNDAARGLICGMTHGSTAAHLARAALEAIAYQIRDVFDIMETEAQTELKVLLADGGASQNPTLMQFQADIIGHPVLQNTSADVSALGAAYLAGLTTGYWQTLDEITQLSRQQNIFEPHMSASCREALYAGWQTAIARALL